MPKKKRNKKDYYETEDLSINKEIAITQVLRDFKRDEDSRAMREAIWKKDDSMYYGRLAKKVDPWAGCSNMAHPMPRIVCDTMSDNLCHSFPTGIDLVKPVPVSNDDHLKANKRGEFLNFQVKTELKFDDVKPAFFQVAVRYGDVFTKQYYDIQRRDKTDQEIEEELSSVELVEGQEIPEIDPMVDVFHGVKWDIINIEDIYKPPDSIGVQKETCAHVIQRVRLSRPEYENRVTDRGYAKIDFTKKSEGMNSSVSITGTTNDDNRKNVIGISKTLYDTDYFINLLEWHGAFYNEKNKTWQEVVILIHPVSHTVCKAYVNNLSFRPFVQHSPRENANQPYHEGYPEIVAQLAHYLNTILNQRRDSESKRIAQPGFYDKGAGFNPKNYLLKPNGMYPTSGPPGSSVYFPQFQGAPPELFTEEDRISELVNQLTGISEPVKGQVSTGDKSATEIQHVMNRFNIRFGSVFSRFELSLMEVVQQCSELNKHYMREDKEYRVLGHNGKYRYDSIRSSDMQDKFDIVFKGNSVANDVAEQQKAMQVYQLGIGNPLITTNPPFLYNHLKRLYEKLHVERIDELIPVPIQSLTRTPSEEHELMYKGIRVEVQLNENAESHWSEHQQEMDQLGWKQKTDPFIQALFLQHTNSTNGLKAAQLTAKQSGTQSTVGPSGIDPNNAAPAAPVGGAPVKPISK